MDKKTYVAGQLEAAGEDKASFDAAVKNILADKQILARILKYTLEECKDMEIEDIISCIEAPEIGTVPVEPGITNAEKNRQEFSEQNPQRIKGALIENTVQHEGTVYFDILFHVTIGEARYRIYVNVEAQRTSDVSRLGYHIENRMVFYIARIISSQKETEFTASDYDSIKHVKSIWICMDSKQDSIVRFRFTPEVVFGMPERKYMGGQIEGIIINIRSIKNAEKSKNILIAMLEDLLKSDTIETKKENLESYGIKMTRGIEGGTNSMSSLADLIEERAMERGEEKLAELINFLMKDNMTDMISIVTTDKIKREEMYHKYNL